MCLGVAGEGGERRERGGKRGREGGREIDDDLLLALPGEGLPSMSTLRASLSTLMVEKRTRMENRKVQIGSASFHSGLNQMM